MNNKITIFLSALFVLSFTFHYIFYNYVEDVKYSIDSNESLDMELEFDSIEIIERIFLEYGQDNYQYKVLVNRENESALFTYNDRATINELPPKNKEESIYCKQPTTESGIFSNSNCYPINAPKDVPYVSSIIYMNVKTVLLLLIIHLINVKFKVFDIEKFLFNKTNNKEYKRLFGFIGNFFINFKHHLLDFLKSIIYAPFIALIFVFMGYNGFYSLAETFFSLEWGYMIALIIFFPIIPALNFYYVYNSKNNFGREILFFYHMIISIIITLFLLHFCSVFLEFLDNQNFSSYTENGYDTSEFETPRTHEIDNNW
jgi:hypothetical protein